MKKILLTTLKLLVSVGIIAVLFYYALRTPQGRQAFADMLRQQKQWHFLVAAAAAMGAATVLTLIRWCYLVRAWASPSA